MSYLKLWSLLSVVCLFVCLFVVCCLFVCCLLFVCLLIVRCSLFVRLRLHLPANPRPHANFQKNIKNKLPQPREYHHQTQWKTCCLKQGSKLKKVAGKYVLWMIYFTIRILAPMSILTLVNITKT